MSEVPKISMTFKIGPKILMAAPAELTEALSEVTVSQSDRSPTTFQLVFNAQKKGGYFSDYAMLIRQQVRPGLRVGIAMSIPGHFERVILDGFISTVSLTPSQGSKTGSITASGEDVGILMDRTERSMFFPAMGDYEIVNLVLIKYALLGIIPLVIPTLTSMASDPLEDIPNQQNATDRALVTRLAAKNGYTFMVRPGPVLGVSKAYWGPKIRIGMPQPPLNVDLGPSTNVDSINFTFDATAVTLYDGTVQDFDTEIPLPVFTLASMRLPPLAVERADIFNGGMRKKEIFENPGEDIVSAFADAQAMTDLSVDNAVIVSGEVDTLRYGWILSCPGLVQVRGAGLTNDGLYQVQGVTHSIKRGEYKQQFQLSREGQMTTIPGVLQ